MKETALFVGWGGVYPGRERVALEGYYEWLNAPLPGPALTGSWVGVPGSPGGA